MRFERCRLLFGEKKFGNLRKSHVLILGVGGVGSYALDCLYRSGVGRITILDYDIYEESNRNRQIGSDGAVGECKVSTLARLYPGIEVISRRMDTDWAESFDFDPYDLVLDCADTTRVKIAVARRCYRKLIMSMGSAGRIDASLVQAGSIWESRGDALARKIRNELRRVRFDRNFTVVFSPEEPACGKKGSFVGVTGTFGLMMCSEAIKKLLDS